MLQAISPRLVQALLGEVRRYAKKHCKEHMNFRQFKEVYSRARS